MKPHIRPRLQACKNSDHRLTSLRLFSTTQTMAQAVSSKSLSLCVVGDVHCHWSPADAAAVQYLAPDMTLFVGDFDDVNVVSQIAAMPSPKAAILGNHDASHLIRGMSKWKPSLPKHTVLAQNGSMRSLKQLAEILPNGADDPLLQQLRELGPSHIGYAACQVPGKAVSIVGSRPFSLGGPNYNRLRNLTTAVYPGMDTVQDSGRRVCEVASAEAAAGNTVVLISHNAPSGLGNQPHDISGVDWTPGGGDHGDPDLRFALDRLMDAGVFVPLVLCGHMHHKVKGGGQRRMVHVDPGSGTITLNSAVVPRTRRLTDIPGHSSDPTASLHHFLTVQLQEGQVMGAADVWVKVELAGDTFSCNMHTKREVLRRDQGLQGSTIHYWDAFEGCWQQQFVMNQANEQDVAPALQAPARL